MTGYTGPILPSTGSPQADAVIRLFVAWIMSTPMQGHLNASGLADIAGLTPTDGNIIVGDGANFVAESGATARASLGLAIGTDVQAFDADLTTLAGLAKTDGNFIVGNGTAWVAESGATARASLGLAIGSNVQAYDADLAALAALATTGMLARTGAGTAAARTITAGAGISITNGDGVAGNPAIAAAYRAGQTVQEVVATSSTDDTTTAATMQNSSLVGTITPQFNNSVIEIVAVYPSAVVQRVAGSPSERRMQTEIRNETDSVSIGPFTNGHQLIAGSSVSAAASFSVHMLGRYTVDSLDARTFRVRFLSLDATNLQVTLQGTASPGVMILKEIKQ